MNKTAFDEKNQNEAQTDRIREAQRQFRENRQQGLSSLNQAFRNGLPPEPPLNGPYTGELVALDIAPGINQLLSFMTRHWMPWKGKYFVKAEQRGDNIFTRSSRVVFRLFFPFYGGVIKNPPEHYRAFKFRTYVSAGRVDTDRQVLKIDYDDKSNPALSIRRILDELVQVEDGVYLGKVHFKWWWGTWQLIAYFSLRSQKP